jgi:hypothetical protein
MKPEPASRSRLRDHRLLLAVTVLGPLCEAVPLRYFRITAGLAPQVTAPVPFGIYHDLRWVAVFNKSWWSFALELAALVVFRTLFTAATVQAAWPRTLAPRPWRTAVRASGAYTVVATLVLAPSATVAFAAGATSLSWLVFAALPTFLLFALALSHGGVGRSLAHLPTPRTLGWAILTFLELDVASAVIVLGPWWLAWCSAGLAGLFNAWAWRGLVGSLAVRPPASRPLPAVPAVLVVLFVVIGGGVALGFTHDGPRRGTAPLVFPRGLRGRVAILVAHGFDSAWSGTAEHLPVRGTFYVSRYSYRGASRSGAPLAYGSNATHAPLARLERAMDVQVRALYRATGNPVRILAVSEGGIVARSYVQAYPDAPVNRLVIASALVEPGRVYYPPRGRDGWGFATGWAMRGIGDVVHAITGVDMEPDAGFLRSVVDHAPALRTGMLCPAPNVPIVVTLPVASDASIPPTGAPVEVPVHVVAALHGNDVKAATKLITGSRLSTRDGTVPDVVNRLLRASATAWMVPELPVRLNPVWEQPRVDGSGCPLTGWPGGPGSR